MNRKLILLLLIATLCVGCKLTPTSPSAEIAKNIDQVRIGHFGANRIAIPVADKLTIVNFFDEFATGCPTGNRFETMEKLNSSLPSGTNLLLIFSDKQFSPQDFANFKAILPMADSLAHGDIEPIRPQLTDGNLLVVLDSKRKVVWQEESEMSEPEVLSQILQLIESSTK